MILKGYKFLLRSKLSLDSNLVKEGLLTFNYILRFYVWFECVFILPPFLFIHYFQVVANKYRQEQRQTSSREEKPVKNHQRSSREEKAEERNRDTTEKDRTDQRKKKEGEEKREKREKRTGRQKRKGKNLKFKGSFPNSGVSPKLLLPYSK